MTNISVVIITKNAAGTIAQVLGMACHLSEDVVVLDSFSKDKTKEICQKYPVRFFEQEWKGFSPQKNDANQLAKHNWILSIDADEELSLELIDELKNAVLHDDTVYNIPFVNIYCGKKIRFGRWRNEKHIRLFNKNTVYWKEDAVHEALDISGKKIKTLQHPIYHYSMESKAKHLEKAKVYANLGAEKLFTAGKKSGFAKRFLNPPFRFVKDFIFSLGFLDGKEGFQIALIQAKETFWKYKKLKEMGA